MAATDAIEDCTVPAWIFPFGKYSPENIAKHTRKCFVRGDDFDIATIEETMPKVMPNPKPKLWSVRTQIGDSRFAPTPLTIEVKQSEEEAGETMMESVMATTTSQPSILPSNLQTVSVAQDTPAR